jgi:hypothetical protein
MYAEVGLTFAISMGVAHVFKLPMNVSFGPFFGVDLKLGACKQPYIPKYFLYKGYKLNFGGKVELGKKYPIDESWASGYFPSS